MKTKNEFTFFYTASRIFWSIYFVLGIALVGVFAAYVFTIVLYSVAFLLQKFERVSRAIILFAEYGLCFSIRFLLLMQPWLKCRDNFQDIYGFFDRYRTRKVMIVSNHRSNLDTFLLISLIPGLRGLAKSSLYYNVFFAPIMMVIGFVPIEKGNLNDFIQGLKKLKTRLLDRNRAVLVFPETKRCEKNFPSIMKFSSAIFDTAIQSDAIVVPVFVWGTDAVMGRGDLLLHPFMPVELKIMEPVRASDYASATELSDHVWNLLSNVQQQRHQLCS